MTRERVWFIFIILLFIVLVSVLLNNFMFNGYEKDIVKSESEYVVNNVHTNTQEDEIVDPAFEVMEKIKPNQVGEGCYLGGCNNQICTDVENVTSDCTWHETYACYENGVCQRQPDGECGWTRTEEIMQCIKETVPELAAYIE